MFALGVPVIIALNKVDRLKAAHIAEQMSGAAKLAAGPKALAAEGRFRADHPAADWVDNFHALHPVSAKTGDGIAALRDELVALLPEGPLYFPVEQRSDLSVEMQISELIREKALWLTRDEVPHSISVEVESIEEKNVTASILVETESQKLILVGKGGSMIKDIGTRARPGDRGAARPLRLPRAAGQGAAEVAPRRRDARAPRPLGGIVVKQQLCRAEALARGDAVVLSRAR